VYSTVQQNTNRKSPLAILQKLDDLTGLLSRYDFKQDMFLVLFHDNPHPEDGNNGGWYFRLLGTGDWKPTKCYHQSKIAICLDSLLGKR
jgi:hypothetical protein